MRKLAVAMAFAFVVVLEGCTLNPLGFRTWVPGRWVGGKKPYFYEEVWTAKAGDAHMGCFRLVIGDKPVVYEFMRLWRDQDEWVLEITHFDGRGMIWPNQPVIFRSKGPVDEYKIVYEQDGVQGKTLTYEFEWPDRMRVTLIDPEDAEPSVFDFRRVKGD